MSTESLGDLIVRVLGDSSNYEKMLENVEKKLGKVSESLEKAGTLLTKTLTAPILAFSGLSVKAFSDFENALVNGTSRMSGMTDDMQKQLAQNAINISRAGHTGAIELAGAYEDLANAGFNAQKSLQALGVAETFASANSVSTKEGVHALTEAQRVLGLTSNDAKKNTENLAHISDLLTQASLMSGESVDDLTEALRRGGGRVMKEYNLSLEQTLAILTSLNKQGLRGGRAGMALAGLTEGADTGKSKALLSFLGAAKEQTDKFAEALTHSAGVSANIAEQRMKTFENQVKNLKNQFEAIGIEIGQMLVPYLEKAAAVVQKGVQWWNSLSQSTKEYIVGAALVLATIGPMLVGFSMLAGLVGTLITFVASATAWWLALTAASALVVAALIFVIDTFRELTGRTNLGLNTMVQNFRIGGTKISTWFIAAWLTIFDAWEYTSSGIVQSWEQTVFALQNLGGKLYRGLVSAFKGIGRAWIDAQYEMHLIDEKEVAQKIANLNAIFNPALEKSLSAAELRQSEYYDKIDSMGRESAEKRAAYEAAIQKAFADDLVAKDKENKEKVGGIKFKLPDVQVPGLNLPDFSNPALGTPAAAGSSKQNNASFLVQSLRRFSIADRPGSLATATPKAEEVKAPGVEKKLDTLITVTKNKNTMSGSAGILGD